MKFFDMFSRKAKIKPDEDDLDPKKVKAILDYHQKSLEEVMDQINALDRATFVAIPSLASSNAFGRKGLPLECAVKEAYLTNPTVYACVQAIAQSLSMAVFTLHEIQEDGQASTISRDPILDLLENPNDTHTREEFIILLAIDLLLCGNALVYKNTGLRDKTASTYKKGRGVSELLILNPDHVNYIDNGHKITQYVGKEKTPLADNSWAPEEIIHFRLPNPLNLFWGISPVQAAYRAIDVDSKILEWWMNTLENGCKKDALIKFKHELTENQFRRVRNLIDQQMAGFTNGRGYLILGHEADMQFLDMAPAELDFTQSRKDSEKAILSIFRVPPQMVGNMDSAAFNNVDAMYESFWLDTIMPLLLIICSTFTKRLLPEFGRDINKYYLGFNPLAVQPLRSLYYKGWKCVIDMVGTGVPLNMAVKKLDLQLPEIEGGDQGYMSHNFVPLGFYNDRVTADVNDPNVY